MSKAGQGIAAIIVACAVWGLAPVYYRLVAVPPLEMLAHRTLWTLLFFGTLLVVQGRFRAVPALITGAIRGRVWLAAAIVSFNWGLFIWAVKSGYAIEASLGYYIFPLVAVVLGVVVLGERLSIGQGLAVALAAAAVGVLTWGLGVAPWVALALAFSFAPYMLLKKRLDAPAVVSVTAEVTLIAPFALGWLLWQHFGTVGGGAFGRDWATSWLLPITGLITGGPLILFSWGAQRVRLSTLGLTQYLNPTLQVFSAVVIFGEPFTVWHRIAFGMIWAGLAAYSLESWRQERGRQERAARSAAASEAASGTAL
ncbi:EamA family transporter RarD [Gemmobacter aquarius]|uniref:EamA family transporter RarD n=1 Tax=Paragemmobacter aquarius TaxID=2169400 RepID=A0A2S0UMJ2_9RHOB|nr:EamA family transporter RarD [Gemmobacter aquarius]AWB48990.1 EamA family transporter RarD [Gemmobacter aquarius]